METYEHDYPQTEHDDSYLETDETVHHGEYADHSEILPAFADDHPAAVNEFAASADDNHETVLSLEDTAYAAGTLGGEELAMGNGKDFATNFKACMSIMGMPAPTELFGTYEKALASAALIAAAAEKFGTGVTIAELVGAGLLSEVFLAIGACGAAAYLGVCGGCVITAGKESLIG
jgi:hypothetical protein